MARFYDFDYRWSHLAEYPLQKAEEERQLVQKQVLMKQGMF